MDYEVRNNLLESENQLYKSELKARLDKIKELSEENRKLKESLDIATKCSSKEEDGIIRLSEENRKLKEDLERYKKQYKHSMGEDYIDEDLYDLDC